MNHSDPPVPNRQTVPNRQLPDSTSKPDLPIDSGEPPVPSFGCIVYFSISAGEFRGRVANLAGIEVTAANQREMLGQIVGQFKSTVAASLADGKTPNWIDPPAEKREDEKKVFLPVHL